MGLGAAIASKLGLAGKYAAQLGAEAAPAVEKAAISATSKPSVTQLLLQNALPNAVLTTGMNLIGGAGLPASLAAGAINLGADVGLTRLAGKLTKQGKIGTVEYRTPEGKLLTQHQYMPSGPEAVAQFIAPIASSIATMPLMAGQQQVQNQQASNIDQTSTLQQQSIQRAYLNNLLEQSTSPGTNFQLQGIPDRAMQQYQNPQQQFQVNNLQFLNPYQTNMYSDPYQAGLY